MSPASISNCISSSVTFRGCSASARMSGQAQIDGPGRGAARDRHVAQLPLLRARLPRSGCGRPQSARRLRHICRLTRPWIPERSATRLREADLNVLSKLGNQGLEGRLEPEAFTGGEVGREDDLLDVLVGCPVDIQVAWQPST